MEEWRILGTKSTRSSISMKKEQGYLFFLFARYGALDPSKASRIVFILWLVGASSPEFVKHRAAHLCSDRNSTVLLTQRGRITCLSHNLHAFRVTSREDLFRVEPPHRYDIVPVEFKTGELVSVHVNARQESYWALERKELVLGKLINSHTNIVLVTLPGQSSSTCCSFCRLFAVLSRYTESLGEEIQIREGVAGYFRVLEEDVSPWLGMLLVVVWQEKKLLEDARGPS